MPDDFRACVQKHLLIFLSKFLSSKSTMTLITCRNFDSGSEPLKFRKYLANFRQNVRSTKCPFDKMSVRQNVRSTKCPFGKMSIRQNDRPPKMIVRKLNRTHCVMFLFMLIFTRGRAHCIFV
jgi:hypothetical protein